MMEERKIKRVIRLRWITLRGVGLGGYIRVSLGYERTDMGLQ